MIRVNGFRGGKLPPKSQIQQIRFRRNMFAADTTNRGSSPSTSRRSRASTTGAAPPTSASATTRERAQPVRARQRRRTA
jgi:hypothetical protein